MMDGDIETVCCSNCKRDILAANYVIHSVHCEKNLSLCGKCHEAVPKNQLERHYAEQHRLIPCSSCFTKVEKCQLPEHLANDCNNRKLPCSICHIQVSANDINGHEEYCGARTEKCADCGQYVMLKDMQPHLESNHSFIRLSEAPAPPLLTLRSFLPATSSGQNQGQRIHKPVPAPIPVLEVDNNVKREVPLVSNTGLLDFEKTKARNLEELFDTKNETKPGCPSNEENKTKYKGKIDSSIHDNVTSSSTGAISRTKPRGTASDNRASTGGIMKRESRKTDRNELMKTISWSDGVSSKSNITQEKRNNYQPQINRKENYKQKEQNVKASPLVASPDTSDLDRLIALQLSEDDSNNEMLKSVTDEMQSHKVSRNTSHRYIYDDDDEFLLYDLPSQPDHEFDYSDDVKLPCEFCNKLIASSDLILHQTGCSPEQSQVAKYTARSEVNNFRHNNKLHDYSNGIDSTELPCEFCDQLIPIFRLTSHQIICKTKLSSTNLKSNLKKVNNSDVGCLSPGARRRLHSVTFDTGLQNGIDSLHNSAAGGTRPQLLQANRQRQACSNDDEDFITSIKKN